MKSIIVNKIGFITDGVLRGFSGKVVGYDSVNDEVMIELDDITITQISSDYIEQ